MRRATMTPTSCTGIFKIPNGFFIRVRVKDPRTGRLREVNCTREDIGLKEAKAIREQLREEAQTSRQPVQERMTLGDYAHSWYKRGLPKWKRSTQERYLDALEHHILPYLGAVLVDQIRRSDVEEWKAAMALRKKPVAHVKAGEKARKKAAKRKPVAYEAKTINGWFRVLTALLGDAVADFNLDHDPTLRVKELPERNHHHAEPNCLNDSEVWPFLEGFRRRYPRFFPIVTVATLCGLRWGEVSALEWGCIDEAAKKILVNKAHYRGTLSTTKTGVARSVPVNDFILGVLGKHREVLKAANVPVGDTDLVFPSKTGGYSYSSLLHRAIMSVLKELGVPRRLTVHGLRRTYNNLMRQAVQDTVVVQAMTGHSSDRMTEHYSFVSDGEKQKALGQLFEKLGPGLADPMGMGTTPLVTEELEADA